jgi:hypothetical protein
MRTLARKVPDPRTRYSGRSITSDLTSLTTPNRTITLRTPMAQPGRCFRTISPIVRVAPAMNLRSWRQPGALSGR